MIGRARASLGLSGAPVKVSQITVAYQPGVPTLQDLSLSVAAGESVALLGPSGCGKTTLLRAIAGLERPAGGEILIGDTPVYRHGAAASKKWVGPESRNVGMVFQDGGLFPHLTVAQNISFGVVGRFRRRNSVDHEVVNELLRLVDLEGYGHRLPGTLSGGQQQRVALARALAPRPQVLLLDEPFSALDTTLRAQVRSEVAHILREIGVTVIFVTHDQDEAFVLGDRVAVMEHGRITQIGTPDQLYRSPRNLAVGAFVGEANILGARIVDGLAETVLGPIPILAPIDGDRADILVRPEALHMHAGEGAVIEYVEYYGHDTRYDLRLPDGTIVIVRDAHDVPRSVGETVGVKFVGSPVMAWPAD
ncbi:MAG: ABC transporter ATP-binding protein [Acidimicrobiales bacterium]|nr:ABC transporter ATP-binding protein [Acidimicrobiales bacterium]